jgi:hypothetical protein
MNVRIDSATNNPIVDLLTTGIDGDVRTTVVRLDGALPVAVAPAVLIELDSRRPALQLHRLTHFDDGTATFETYGLSEDVPVQSYVLQSWWAPDALELVKDTTRAWTSATYGQDGGPYPDDGPDFCVLTYESLEPGTPAYTDQRGSWISVEGYERFIAGDLLRLRS